MGEVCPDAKENARIRPQSAIDRTRNWRPDGSSGFGLQKHPKMANMTAIEAVIRGIPVWSRATG